MILLKLLTLASRMSYHTVTQVPFTVSPETKQRSFVTGKGGARLPTRVEHGRPTRVTSGYPDTNQTKLDSQLGLL